MRMEGFEEDAEYSSDDELVDSEAEGSVEESSSDNENLEQPQSNKRKIDAESHHSKRLKTENAGSERKKDKGLYKPPTAEEFNELRDTETLFHSNLHRLEIEELLKEVTVRQRYKNFFNNWFENFGNFIRRLPEYGEIKLSELEKANGKTDRQKFINALIDIHQSVVRSDRNVILKFIKPEQHNTFGLHKINATLGPQLTVDINVTMPKSCFLERDYLNNRYLVKRDYYISYIYLHLKETDLCSDSSYIENHSILHIVPPVSENVHIRIHVMPPENSFKLSRFEPRTNNVRENLDINSVDTTQLKECGTPFYNSILLHDLTLISNYEFVENTLQGLQNVQDGIRLLSVWLRQRGLYSDHSGFSENLLTHTILYLTLKKKINKQMSSYQVIRNFWVFLSTSNWHKMPISICGDVKPERFKAFREDFDVVFLDKSGCYNLAAFLHLNVYEKIRSEAELAVRFLDDMKYDSFGALFTTKMNPEIQYDALLILKDSHSFQNVYNGINAIEKCKYIGCFQTLIIRNILLSLKKGLNKRVVHIVPLATEEKGKSSFTKVTFGITLNPSEAFKVTEKGPPSNSPEAVEFTKFWGRLSECRRFADGSICEAVYFPTQTFQEKRKIFKRVINFIAIEKLAVEEHIIIADEFESMLVLKNYITPFPTGTNEEASVRIICLFDELSKKLRECNLPLEITTVHGASEVFSYTALFPPIASNYKWGKKLTTCEGNNIILNDHAKFAVVPKYVEPIDCVIQLGMNSKWPHDLEALQHLKLGFYLELSKKLHQEFRIISSVKPEFLEVLYKGLVFRFRLYNPREIATLKKYTKPDGTTAFKETEESIELEKNLLVLPRIIGSLHGIQSENPSYGPSTALIKRWLRSQLIDEYHIPDIVIDLLNASLYLRDAPYNSANLPQVAFLRFLKHIAEFDYERPLPLVIVNFNDELTKDILDNYETNFQKNRQNYPLLCIITPYDEKSLFSKQCSKEILMRFSLLAKATYEVMQIGIANQHLSVKELFVPNLDGYHVFIHLKPLMNPKRHQQLNFMKSSVSKLEIKEYNDEETSKIPVVGFNPVENYLKELRENYANIALFFYNPYGGNMIGVVWKPSADGEKDFKVSYVGGRKLVGTSLVLNKDAIIEDFWILGDGLVKTII